MIDSAKVRKRWAWVSNHDRPVSRRMRTMYRLFRSYSNGKFLSAMKAAWCVFIRGRAHVLENKFRAA